MILNDFLNFNNSCPVCDEPLTLYMQCNDNTLWESKKKGNKYNFKPYKLVNSPFTKNDSMKLTVNTHGVDIEFDGVDIKRNFKTWNLNFFLLCNRSGLNIKGTYAYDINPYYGCYVRTTPWMEFKSNVDKSWELNVINPDHVKLSTVDENFCFKVINSDLEKVYMLNLDYKESKTRLWYYTANAFQRDDKHYEPNLFEKEMPLVGVRPNFTDKNKFISRMDSWILIS
jgi:hypothetical protein